MSNYSTAGGKLYRDDVCLANFVPEVRGVYCSSPDSKSPLIQIVYTVVGYDTPQTTLVFGDHLRKLNFEEIDFACHYETAPSRARRRT